MVTPYSKADGYYAWWGSASSICPSRNFAQILLNLTGKSSLDWRRDDPDEEECATGC
jgi:hypothetical protein